MFESLDGGLYNQKNMAHKQKKRFKTLRSRLGLIKKVTRISKGRLWGD